MGTVAEKPGSQVGWIVMPFFTRPLIEQPQGVGSFSQSCEALPSASFYGNQFWVYESEGKAREAQQVLEQWDGTCVTRVHVGQCLLSAAEMEEFDNITYEGYFLRLLTPLPETESPEGADENSEA